MRKTFNEINADRPGQMIAALERIVKSARSNRTSGTAVAELLAPVQKRLAEIMGETPAPAAPVAQPVAPAPAAARHRIPLVVAAIPEDQLSAYLTQIAARMCEAYETR